MKFGELRIGKASGSILAHTLKVRKQTFRKGRILSEDDLKSLVEAGFDTVVVVTLEKEDIHENTAAQRLARAITGTNLSLSPTATGRCNLIAEVDGLVLIDSKTINDLNLTNEVIAISTVSPFKQISKGDVVATVKIITFGVAQSIIVECEKITKQNSIPINVSQFSTKKIGLIQTTLPVLKKKLLEKTREVTKKRISDLGSTFIHEEICEHDVSKVSRAIKRCYDNDCEVVLIIGASAIADRCDVLPKAVEECGGKINHFGLPVDPGNLMLLAEMNSMIVLGLPGSARSPRLHGFDWILQRLLADINVEGKDLMLMGVGGLLKDIPGRPLPRKRAVQSKI